MAADTTNASSRERGIAERVPVCPNCGYSWEGLPARGTCPECSFAFDDLTKKWVLDGLRSRFAALRVSLTLNAVWITFLTSKLIIENLQKPLTIGSSVLLSLLVTMTALLFFVTWRAIRAPGPYILAAHDLIILHDRLVWPHHWLWTEVSEVRVAAIRNRLRIHIKAGPRARMYRFWSAREEEAAEIIEYIRHYAPHVEVIEE